MTDDERAGLHRRLDHLEQRLAEMDRLTEGLGAELNQLRALNDAAEEHNAALAQITEQLRQHMIRVLANQISGELGQRVTRPDKPAPSLTLDARQLYRDLMKERQGPRPHEADGP